MKKTYMLVSILFFGLNQLFAQENNYPFVETQYIVHPDNSTTLNAFRKIAKGEAVNDDVVTIHADAGDYEKVFGTDLYNYVLAADDSKFEFYHALGTEVNHSISKATGEPVVTPVNDGLVKAGDLVCGVWLPNGARVPVFKVGDNFCINALTGPLYRKDKPKPQPRRQWLEEEEPTTQTTKAVQTQCCQEKGIGTYEALFIANAQADKIQVAQDHAVEQNRVSTMMGYMMGKDDNSSNDQSGYQQVDVTNSYKPNVLDWANFVLNAYDRLNQGYGYDDYYPQQVYYRPQPVQYYGTFQQYHNWNNGGGHGGGGHNNGGGNIGTNYTDLNPQQPTVTHSGGGQSNHTILNPINIPGGRGSGYQGGNLLGNRGSRMVAMRRR